MHSVSFPTFMYSHEHIHTLLLCSARGVCSDSSADNCFIRAETGAAALVVVTVVDGAGLLAPLPVSASAGITLLTATPVVGKAVSP